MGALRLVEVRAVRTARIPREAPSPSRLLPVELLLRPPPTTLRRPPAREAKVQAREQHVCLRLSHTAHEPLAQQPLLHRSRRHRALQQVPLRRLCRPRQSKLVKQRLQPAAAKLRKEFRQRLSVGAWNDMFTHIFKRERFINPTPAAEAKLLGEKMTRNAAFRSGETSHTENPTPGIAGCLLWL